MLLLDLRHSSLEACSAYRLACCPTVALITSSSAGESKEEMDAYTAHMLASLGAPPQQQGSTSASAEAGALTREHWGLQGPGLQLKPESWLLEDEPEERAGRQNA